MTKKRRTPIITVPHTYAIPPFGAAVVLRDDYVIEVITTTIGRDPCPDTTDWPRLRIFDERTRPDSEGA